MWDVTNTPHADTTSSLCLMGLRGQTKQSPTSGSGIGADTICKNYLIQIVIILTVVNMFEVNKNNIIVKNIKLGKF